MKKWRTIKKQMKRLNKALAYSDRYIAEESGDVPEWSFIPARKPLLGKSARRLVGANYAALAESYGDWLFVDRPKFSAGRRYILMQETDELSDRGSTLRICRVEDNCPPRGYRRLSAARAYVW
jgi:hypothetical protein|nr:MAG TPA: hypothetical protein [Caudoviricetes sp.]